MYNIKSYYIYILYYIQYMRIRCLQKTIINYNVNVIIGAKTNGWCDNYIGNNTSRLFIFYNSVIIMRKPFI